jgi:hypothetical protein
MHESIILKVTGCCIVKFYPFYSCLQLNFGPPPVLPDVEKQLKEYLCPDSLPIHDYKVAQKYWSREPNPRSLYHFDVAPLGTTLKVCSPITVMM